MQLQSDILGFLGTGQCTTAQSIGAYLGPAVAVGLYGLIFWSAVNQKNSAIKAFLLIGGLLPAGIIWFVTTVFSACI